MTIMVYKLGNEAQSSAGWTVAKAKLSEAIDRALSEGPQTITRKGRKTVVVVSAEEWERKTKRAGNLAEFFAESPLRGAKVEFRPPDVGFELAKAAAGPRVSCSPLSGM